MRPKRNIILWTGDENGASIIKFALETQLHVRVHVVEDEPEFRLVVSEVADIDLVVLMGDTGGPQAADAGLVRSLVPFRPVVAILKGGHDSAWTVDATLESSVAMTELLVRARVWMQRRRGPRKGTVHARPAEALAGVA